MEQKEREKSCFSASCEKENPIHIEVTKFKLARINLFHIANCSHQVFNYYNIQDEQHESSSVAPPTISRSMVVKRECCEHSSDDDSETFHTPPTSLTPADEVSCSIIVRHLYKAQYYHVYSMMEPYL